LGSFLTPYVITILSRFGNRLVTVPDNDETGDKYVRQIKRTLPKAKIIQCAKGKDIEGFRKLDEHAYEEQMLRELRSLSNPFVRTELFIRR
jgi:DNA primase